MKVSKRMACRLLLLIALSSGCAIWAEPGEITERAPPASLDQLVHEALQNNPDIRASLQRWKAARAAIPQVQTLPDPKVNFVYWGLEQDYLATQLAVIARLKEALYDLHFVHDSMTVLNKSKLLLEDFEQTANARYSVGREYCPGFELNALGLRDGKMGTDGHQAMLNVKVPLYYSTKQREGMHKAVASREATFQDLQRLRQELLARIRNDVAQATCAEQFVKLLRGAIIPQSRLTLASAQASYAVGKVDFLTLLNSLLTLQENELEFHSEMAEHEKTLARLEGILGETP